MGYVFRKSQPTPVTNFGKTRGHAVLANTVVVATQKQAHRRCPRCVSGGKTLQS